MQWLTAFFADPRQSPVAAEAPALQDGTTPSAEQVVPQIEAPCFPALHRAAQTELCTRCSVRIASLCSVLKKVAVAPHGVWMRGSKAFRALRRMQDQQSFAILQCFSKFSEPICLCRYLPYLDVKRESLHTSYNKV